MRNWIGSAIGRLALCTFLMLSVTPSHASDGPTTNAAHWRSNSHDVSARARVTQTQPAERFSNRFDVDKANSTSRPDVTQRNGLRLRALFGDGLIATDGSRNASASPERAPALIYQGSGTPNIVEFDPSSDHAVIANTVPLVTRYFLEVYKPDLTIGATKDLGKPAPVAGKITYVGLIAVMASLPPGNYTAKVFAEGPGGRNGTPASDPFPVVVPSPAAPGVKPVIR